jgi:hypothetical protein
MHINPHVSYTQNGVNGFTGSMVGATVRFASNPAADTFWDIGVGTNSAGTDKLSIGRAGTNYLSITNAGNVGVGTLTAGQKLQIGGGTETGNHYLRIFGASSDIYLGQTGSNLFGAGNGQVLVTDATYTLNFVIGTLSGSGNLILGTANTPRLTISNTGTSTFSSSVSSTGFFSTGGSNFATSSGNVGVGTDNAQQKLHVNGGSLLVNTGTAGNTAFRDIMMGGISGWSNGESHGIDTVYNTAASPTTFSRIESHFDGTSGRIRFRNLFNNSAPQTSILMTIRGNGNVGIGEDSPSGTYGKLTVAGGIDILNDNNAKLEIGRYSSGAPNSYIKIGANSNSFRITNNTDATDLITITNAGSVGIGTDAPNFFGTSFTNQFTVSSSGSSQYANITAAGGSGAGGGIDFGNQTVRQAGIYSLNGSHLGLYTNGANSGSSLSLRLFVASSGTVGIGTDNPGGPLDVRVAGTSSWDRFVATATTLWGDGSTAYVTIGAGGAAGIMMFNPHVVWNSSQSIAGIRLGRSGGVSTGDYFEIGTRSSNEFWLSRNASTSIIYVSATNNVGLGTAAPTNLLHLAGASATPSLRLASTSVGFFYDIGRENATTGDFLINGTVAGVSQGTLLRIHQTNFTVTTAGTVNARNASTSASLNTPSVIGAGEFMSTGSVAGYFWENRSGGVTSSSNWYGWYTASGVIHLYNGSSNLISINGTSGSATFTSSSISGLFTTSANNIAVFNTSNNDGGYITLRRGGSDFLYIGNSSAIGGGANMTDFYTVAGLGMRFFTNASGNIALRLDTSQNAFFGSNVTASRYYNPSGPYGTGESNARNHFTQFNAGNAGLAAGWIGGAFGDALGNRIVIGQYSGVAVIAGHTANLDNWSNMSLATGGGNVLIGTITDDSSGRKLQVSGNGSFAGTNAHNIITATGGDYCYLYLRNQAGPSQRDSYFIQNTSDSTANGVAAGSAYMYFSHGQQMEFNWGGTSRIQFTSTGNITAAAFFESSDVRLKSNIINLDVDTSKIFAKRYIKNGMEEIGYLAQDVEDILPSAVSKRDNGYLNLSYRQVHTAKIAFLEKRIEELELKLKNR